MNIGSLEDEKVSLDDLQEKVQEFEDFVQSTDIAAMQSELRLLQLWIMQLMPSPLELWDRFDLLVVMLYDLRGPV